MRSVVLGVLAVAATAAGLSFGGPGASAEQVVDDYRTTPVYAECRRQDINDNQCYCFAAYIYLNGWGVDKPTIVRVMQAYPLSSQQTIGNEVFSRVSGDGDTIETAVTLITNGTGHCSKWDAR